MIRLAPQQRRERWREIATLLREKLWWVIGRLLNMIVSGISTSVGLAIIDVPAPIVLGVIAGVLTFVPNIGPLLSVIPAAILAFTKGPTTLLWVLALYAVAQALESYVVTPLVQRRAAEVPPALLLTAQTLMGLPFGALGLLLATPIAAVVITLTRELYIHDRLGDHDDGPSTSDDAVASTRLDDAAAASPRDDAQRVAP